MKKIIKSRDREIDVMKIKSLSLGRKKQFQFPKIAQKLICAEFTSFSINKKTYDKKTLEHGRFQIDEKWGE